MKNENSISKSRFPLKNKTLVAALTATAVLIVLILGFILGLRIYYASRWYPNTWIGDRDVSGMKYEETAELMDYVYDNFQLNIYGRNDGSLTITRDHIDYTTNIRDSVREQFDLQHESFPLFSFTKKKQVDLALNASYDEEKLTEVLANSEIYTGSDSYSVTKPQKAKVVYSKEKQYFVIQEETLGNTLDMERFSDAVKKALDTGHEKLYLTDEEENPRVYVEPEVYSTDSALQQENEAYNSAALRFMIWKIDDEVKETVEPKRISKWITYKNGKISYKKMAIRNWVEKLCLKYKTVGITRTFKNHAGKKIRVSGGDYGWAFDYESMVKQLMKVLKKKIDPAKQEAYKESPGSETKKALTFTKKPKYLNTAYQYNYENKEKDWDTKNFTEISLSAQKVYIWRKGKVVFSCRCISGRPVADRKTRKGAYFIKEHQPHRVLKGDDYETPVDNWVRIMWTGTGFHAAPWQPWSAWTKDMYKTRGSHGCLNLSVEDSAKVYKLTSYREMVFIY